MADSRRTPVRISKVANRYLLFDVEDVMYLRRHHNICSPFAGTLPQSPQQNVFMGLPIELMAEEAKVLVEEQVAYVVDDALFHPSRIKSLDTSSRNAYLQVFKDESLRAQLAALDFAEKKKQSFLKNGKKNKKDKKKGEAEDLSSPSKGEEAVAAPQASEETSLFESAPSAPTPKPTEPSKFQVTPNTSGPLLLPPGSDAPVSIAVPKSFPLFAHLHHKGYFMMPGIRFGCDYNVYPGDPLRYHSHFQATGYGWDEDIDLLDIVTCGRLGTTVKKSFLIGGQVPEITGKGGGEDGQDQSESDNDVALDVRAFSIEWAGM